jgi:O-succinylbenzoic acid--CoA ligase
MEAWLTRAARMHPDRAALVTPERTWSYADLHRAARAVGGALLRDGVGPGDRVALQLPSPQLVVALHGCLLIGAVAVPVDLRLSTGERGRRRAGAARVLEALEALEDLPVGPPAPERAMDPDAVATVMFTSGTTAGPKEVTLTVANWLWNAIGSATALGLDPEERWLCPMPLAHVGGLSIQLRCAVYGATVVLHERFDASRALHALMDAGERITLVSLVPTMLARLLDAGLREPPTLRRALLGGGPIAPTLLARAREAGVDVAPSFGMTETCSQIATDGFAALGAELSLAGDGELLVRGPSVSAGALSDDGWLHTGDLAAFDAAGRLEIRGRRAETIISGGENVAPAEVEAVLAAHPAVADAAVLGRADEEWGERVVALIVARDGAAVSPEELRKHCAASLAAFKVPKAFELVDSVPRGPTGKLLRRELH